MKIEQVWRDGALGEQDFYALTEDRRLYIDATLMFDKDGEETGRVFFDEHGDPQ